MNGNKLESTSLKILFIIFNCFILANCGLLPKKGKKVSVNSVPSSEVILIEGDKEVGKSLGQTPVEVDFTELGKSGDFISFKFISEKYEDYKVVVPSSWKQGEIKVKLKRKEKVLPSEVEEKMVEKMRKLTTDQIMSVLAFQKQLQLGDFNKAGSEVVNLKRLRTPAAVIALLEGNLAYIRGNKKQALNLYKRSFTLYPQNYEIKSLIDRINGELGR